MLKILIVEGNAEEARVKSVAMGSLTQSDLYLKTLNMLADDLQCTIACPADKGAELPSQSEFDGVVWTGSALNIYDGGRAIDGQVEYMKQGYDQNARIFGSCWGLQVATLAAGGTVVANEKGREIGIARDIEINAEGRSHPLFAGKPAIFDAVAVHLDHVVELPPGSCVLASNDMSHVQAVEIRRGGSVFWGVQYHPEFDLDYIAVIIRKYNDELIAEGIRKDSADVAEWADDLAAAQHEEGSEDLKNRYQLGSDVLDASVRLLELANWLSWLRQAKASASIDK